MVSAISLGVFWRDGALDERDHPVDEGLAGLARDLDDDPVGQHGRAPGDGAPVAAGLADDGCGLAGDRRLVDGRDPLDDVAVAGDDLAGLDDDEVAEAQLGAPDLLLACRRRAAVGPWSRCGSCAGSRPGPCRGPRRRPRPGSRRARWPRATRRPRSRTPRGAATDSTVVSTEPTQTTKMTGDRKACRGSSLANAWGRASQPVRTRGAAVMTGPPRSARGRGPGRR